MGCHLEILGYIRLISISLALTLFHSPLTRIDVVSCPMKRTIWQGTEGRLVNYKGGRRALRVTAM